MIMLIVATTTTAAGILLLVLGIKEEITPSIRGSSFLLGFSGIAWMWILIDFLSVNFGFY